MGDLDLLVDMGFDKERATLAVKKTGNLQGAIDWLEKNQDKTLEEIKEEDQPESSTTTAPLETGEEARSLKCNECGKSFRGVTQAEFHATKSGHTDFSESTEEIIPLTEEQKAAKLQELRERLASKRAATVEQDKAEKKQNENIRRKATKEGQDIKEDLQKQEQIKEAAKKRAEKKADEAARQKVLDQIQRDKEDRKRKAELEKAQREGRAVPVQEAPVAPPPAKKTTSSYTEARLRLQAEKATVTKTFPAETTLFEVAHAIAEELGFEPETFTTNFPKKVYVRTDFGMTLKEAGLVPSSVLRVA